MEKPSRKIRQRPEQANYLNVSTDPSKTDYQLLGVGAKTLDENPSAQTKSRKYVCDKNASNSISGYNWTTAYDIDQIRSQSAVNFICNIGEKQLVGEDAESDYVIVDLDQKNEDGTYHARYIHIAIEVASFTNDDGEMGCSGNFLGVGDIVEGKFDTKTNTFKPNGAAEGGDSE